MGFIINIMILIRLDYYLLQDTLRPWACPTTNIHRSFTSRATCDPVGAACSTSRARLLRVIRSALILSASPTPSMKFTFERIMT